MLVKGAPGRLAVGEPVAIVDLGSNSVRLVAYEGLTRAPTPIFNEKALCGLGRGVATTGKLSQEGTAKAITALKRFRILCRTMGVRDIHVLATAAARDASNGPQFLAAARDAIGCGIELLTGRREAELAALGVVSSIHQADGIAGDLGGGSLELGEIRDERIGRCVSLPLGGLSLSDKSGRSPKKAAKIVKEAFDDCRMLDDLDGRDFYAVGGTWRAMARVHMAATGYPLHVMHGYTIAAAEASRFAALVVDNAPEVLGAMGSVSPARAPLLAYGALLLEQIIRRGNPQRIVVSALGVREGMLYERLDAAMRKQDPLLAAAHEINILRSRAPRHGEELIDWTDEYFISNGSLESSDERRLRHAVCLMADLSWRAHPDYRGEQAVNVVTHMVLIGIDHPGRAFLAMAAAYRHLGLDEDVSDAIRAIVPQRMAERARILGSAMRVAYVISAAMPAVLPRTSMRVEDEKVVLRLPRALSDLASDRLHNRLKQFGKLTGRESRIVCGE